MKLYEWFHGAIRFHWQNLNERGSGWREGRCWLWLGHRSFCLEFGWMHVRRPLTDFALQWSSWSWTRWQIRFGFLGCSWYFGPTNHDAWPRTTGFYLFGHHFMLEWRNQDMFVEKVGWRKSWFLGNVFLGRAQYTEGVKRHVRVLIPMPERAYGADCALHIDTWKRPRWFARQLARATIDMEPGEQIPFPGKGENSWDCGEDAVWGMTLVAETASDAVAGVVASVLRDRERHGGSVNWQPAKIAQRDT